MNFVFGVNGLSIGRDITDKPVRKESAVIGRALRALGSDWTRYYPNRHGLTDCRIGLRNRRSGEVYWHGNYQVEDAVAAWNKGGLWLNKA
jgi:hypothetical protein